MYKQGIYWTRAINGEKATTNEESFDYKPTNKCRDLYTQAKS